MSQDATRQPLLNRINQLSTAARSGNAPVRSPGGSESGGFAVESYADRLMDDLFSEVEQALDLREEPAPQTVPVTLPPRSVPAPAAEVAPAEPIGLPLAIAKLPADEIVTETAESSELAESDVPENPAELAPAPPRSYDRLLIGISCVSLIVSVAVWLVHQEAKRPMVTPAPSVPSSGNSGPNVSAVDQQFVDYVQQALGAIDRRTQPNSPASQVAKVPTTALPAPTLPAPMPNVTVPVAPNLTPVPPPARLPATGRLKIPGYPLPPSVQSPGATVAPLPRPQAAKPVPVPVPASTPGIARTLTGVVDMGNDRSVVLVEINGVVQRFRLGESIGSSGWTLVEVSQNHAVIRRNGEVRSIFAGQSF